MGLIDNAIDDFRFKDTVFYKENMQEALSLTLNFIQNIF